MTYNVASVLNNLAIIEAFLDLPDARRGEGKRHDQALCLALFTLSISAGCKGFLAISDWLLSYRSELIELFNPAKSRLPSYSTIRRVLLNLDYKAYSNCLAQFFQIDPVGGETKCICKNIYIFEYIIKTLKDILKLTRICVLLAD